MNDIVEQLRYAADDTDAVKNASVAYLLEHAAGEIELLRGYRDEAEADAAVARLLVERLRLTDAEREDLAMWLAECLRQCSAATDGGNEELADRWQGRANRAAAMLERLGGGR